MSSGGKTGELAMATVSLCVRLKLWRPMMCQSACFDSILARKRGKWIGCQFENA